MLFLIPWPWFGPWIAAALIALMFVVWGGWTLYQKTQPRFAWDSTILFVLGAALALATFLLPGVPLLAGGTGAFRNFTPAAYSWIQFGVGYLLMLAALCRFSTKPVNQ